MTAQLLFSGCLAPSTPPQLLDNTKAAIVDQRTENDNSDKVSIFIRQIDSTEIAASFAPTNQYAITSGPRKLFVELRRSMGWDYAPFHDEIFVHFIAEQNTVYWPEIELTDPTNRKKPNAKGFSWNAEAKTGKRVSDKTTFTTEGIQHPGVIYVR